MRRHNLFKFSAKLLKIFEIHKDFIEKSNLFAFFSFFGHFGLIKKEVPLALPSRNP